MNKTHNREVIGLIPAAGRATRIAPLPCSKEIYPVGFRRADGREHVRPKVVSHYLLEKLQSAGVLKAFIILRDGKWDIPSYFGDGSFLNMHLAYLMMGLPYGVPYTLDQAYPYVQDSIVALGFPDIMFQPDDAYSGLLAKQQTSKADIVLGVFPATQPHKTDMVELDSEGQILSLDIKPAETDLLYTWQIAVWTPRFTHFMHTYISSRDTTEMESVELFVGDVIQAAIINGFRVDSVLFENGNYLDIGTPEDLTRAVQIAEGISHNV